MDLNFYLPISFQESSHVKEAKNGVNQGWSKCSGRVGQDISLKHAQKIKM